MSATATAADALAAALPGRVWRDAPSAQLTTYRCGGPIAVLVRAGSPADLEAVADAVREHGTEVLVVGRGSNLLVADEGFDGIGVVLEGGFDALDVDAGASEVRAGGAVALPVLARRAAAAGVGGLEFFVGIPGSVGGAVRMNAGGHGRETRDVLVDACVFSFDTASTRVRGPEELALGYRRSALGPRDVVTAARFAGVPAEPADAGGRIEEIVRWRREHQPGGQNAGSVFTNPPGDAAGRLIDACGLKGLRIGGVCVSEKHANFFVADPGARAADVRALVREVQRRVAAATGVHLEPEVHMVGFPEEDRG
ncbi:MAG: UDP-N-acetylenolpyruvoylglucosamine reductase [Acidimicrobiia bacterium]|nr:MAG: UDP-N-acetylenolpyruvoylglucosamine reductase [Acidimicrobiia bacterium]